MKTVTNLIVFLVVLYLIFRAYSYLGDLRNCGCAPQVSANRLHHLELFYIVLLVIGFVARLNATTLLKLAKSAGKYAMGLFTLVIFAAFAAFVYYAHVFAHDLSSSCDCAKRIERYIVYVQAVYYFVPIALLMLSFIVSEKYSKYFMGIVLALIAADVVYINYGPIQTMVRNAKMPLANKPSCNMKHEVSAEKKNL